MDFKVKNYKIDLIVCFGVVYHAQNCNEFLEKILSFNVPVLLEYAHSYPLENENFNPEKHENGKYGPMNESWLISKLKKYSHKIYPFEKYNNYCSSYGILDRTKGQFTRSGCLFLPVSNN